MTSPNQPGENVNRHIANCSETGVIDVGNYRLEILPDGSIYLSNMANEGMGVDPAKFEKVLDKFFKEEF